MVWRRRGGEVGWWYEKRGKFYCCRELQVPVNVRLHCAARRDVREGVAK